jgi:small subunit ribosomal protein S24e
MDIKVIEDRNNPMLDRREVIFKIEHDGPTPSRKSVVDNIVATMNSKQGLVVVDRMKTEFGKRETVGYAKIYESVERVIEVERPYVIERNAITAPAPEKAPEKVVEEVVVEEEVGEEEVGEEETEEEG